MAAELSAIDEMCIENVAEYCLHETCDVTEYEALINQLEEQRDHFISHVANVESLLNRLKNSNHPEHDPTEVQQLIADIKDTLNIKPAPLRAKGEREKVMIVG
jgi:CCR4-NOT transcriptional regulation complex NOT5 subunit